MASSRTVSTTRSALLLKTAALAFGAAVVSTAVLLAPSGDLPAAQAEDHHPVVTFSGFQSHEDGSSTVHVEMSKVARVTVKSTGKTLVYTIEDAKIRWRNNKYPLRTEHFASNVLSSKLDQKKTGVVLTIVLRTETAATHKVVSHAAGARLVVDVPAPAAPSKPAEEG